jgi:hypothetical protein
MFPLDTKLLLQAFGVVFFGIGMAARLGLWKRWYWKTRGTVYGYVPLGLLFLLYSFEALAAERLGSRYVFFQGAVGLLIVLGLWWSLRPPAFVRPAWVRWVERHPRAVIQAMSTAAEEDEGWEQHVTSREAVDAWAKSLQRSGAKSKKKG